MATCNAFYMVRDTQLPELLDELTVFKDEGWLKQRKKYIEGDESMRKRMEGINQSRNRGGSFSPPPSSAKHAAFIAAS